LTFAFDISFDFYILIGLIDPNLILIIIKSWCLNESAKYCGQSIIGSKHGMLSAYAITVMVLSLFSEYRVSLDSKDTPLTPFAVLRKFLLIYSTFNWESFVVTADGPVAIQNGNPNPNSYLPPNS
jgi:hypothetical protein